jgi:hypothetical protein
MHQSQRAASLCAVPHNSPWSNLLQLFERLGPPPIMPLKMGIEGLISLK